MIIGCLAASTAAPAAAGEAVEVTPLLTTRQTASGQPILLPQRDVQVVVSRFVIQPGTTLPVHLHPWQRYGYLLSGELEVTLADNGRVIRYSPGDFIGCRRDLCGNWLSGVSPVG